MRTLRSNLLSPLGFCNKHLFHRFHCNRYKFWLEWRTIILYRSLYILTNTRNSPTCSTTTHQYIHKSIRISPYLRPSRFPMNLGIGWIFKLLQHIPITIQLFYNLPGLGQCPRNSRFLGCQHHFSSKRHEHNSSFNRHGLWHGQNTPITSFPSNKCKSNTGISRRGFHQYSFTRSDESLFFSFVNERSSQTILHRGARAKRFKFSN
mmetsp:Transcript_17368/g.32932  ORF Transcript_17368/g.32932 Transcript_17368/m.32932 type:complete len:206 (-) Transcript_17368:286-903(-)